MATVRLTNYSRDRILKRVLDFRFSEVTAQLKVEQTQLGDKFYNDVYLPATQKMMLALGPEFFRQQNHLYFRLEGGTSKTQVFFDKYRLIANDHYNGVAKIYDDGHPLRVEWEKLEGRVHLNKENREYASTQARNVLWNCSTLQKLLQVWPEVEPFTDEFRNPEPTRALVVPIQNLNELLGLPPSTPVADVTKTTEGDSNASD
jgi:hypothetical protein